MIRARRRQHRAVFIALALVVPLLLAVTQIWRPTVPPVADIDTALRPLAGIAPAVDWQPRRIITGRHSFQVQRLDDREDGQVAVAIEPESVILKPELLVYWTPQTQVASQLDPTAVLVGSLAGTSRRLLMLPAAASTGDGNLLVYSFAHQEIVDHFALRTAFGGVASEG